MAIKRWNANTSTWELIGTPGTVTPAAIGAAALSGVNTFTGNQIVNAQIGINTSNPVGQLDINTVSGQSNLAIQSGSQSRWWVSAAATPNNYLSIGANGGTAPSSGAINIDAAGRIGAGTTSPSGRITSTPYDGNIIAAWTQASFVASGSYGGSYSLIDGAAGWNIRAQEAGAKMIIGYAATSSSLNNAATFSNNGNFGVGTTEPTAKIHINGNTTTNSPLLRIVHGNSPSTFNWSASMMNGAMGSGASNIALIGYEESTRNCGYIGYRYVSPGSTQNAITFGHFAVDNVVNIDGNGYLLAGYLTSNGAYRLQVNSQIFATSSSIATSDGRYKENVLPITSGLDIIDSLNPVSFDWKEHPVHNFVEGKTVGFIAQEVKEALKDYEWVNNIIKTNTTEAVLDEEGNEITPAEEFLGIAESNIIPLLVAAVKELRAEVNTLKAQVNN